MFIYVLIFHLMSLFVRVLYVLFRDIDLSTEEAQYWLWSKHLDLSYYSKPPMIAYINFLSTSILGDTEIGVRINAIILGFFMAIGVYYFTKYLFKDEKLAFFSSVFIYLIPGYELSSILFLTDTPLAFFYLMLVFYFYKSVKTNRLSDWVLTGVFGGLAFFSKFSAVLFIIPAFMFILIYRREVFKERYLYLSILIAGLFTLPVLYWNISNDFVTFKHVGKLAGANQPEFAFNLKHLGDYIAGQIAINSPFLFPFMVYAVYRAFKERDEKLIYLAITSVSIFFIFLVISIKKNVEANWPAFAYVSLYILTAYYLYTKLLRKAIIPMAISGITIIVLFYTPILDKIGLTTLLPPKKDPTKRLVGWSELGEYVSSLTKQLGDRYFIFSDSYHISSELAFYVRENPQTYCIRIDRRMNQFDLWTGIQQFENKGYYGIYVADHPITDRVKDGFEAVLKEDVYRVKYRGEFVKEFYVYVLKNYIHIEEDPILSY